MSAYQFITVPEMENTCLGFDLSTQQLKVVAINEALEVVADAHVQFDTDLPEFGTCGGVNTSGDVVTAKPVMWTKALDLLLQKLVDSKFNFSTVVVLSGCAQQLGSVYWGSGSGHRLATMNPSSQLTTQMETSSIFSVPCSPVWLDSSSTWSAR